MSTDGFPWFEMIPSNKSTGLSGSGWHAQFACLVQIQPAKELEAIKWGWNLGGLLEEAMDRQRLFIASQHFPVEPGAEDLPGCRTLALRYLHDPQSSGMQLALVAKVCAETENSVRNAAADYWWEIRSTFPYDYNLLPATTRDEFQRVAGWHILNKANGLKAFSEIQRYEGVVSTGKQRFYLLGSWKLSKLSNEQIWRVLAGAAQPVLLDVLLRPAILKEGELAALQVLAKNSRKIADENDLITVKPYAEMAAENFTSLLGHLRRPYIVQMRLVAPDGLPEYIPRTIGVALTNNPERVSATPGFQIISPQKLEEIDRWLAQLYWLEPDLDPGRFAAVSIARIRKMTDVEEAHLLFRLPFPPGYGIPGVQFITELQPGDDKPKHSAGQPKETDP